jgi:CxxC-x17-CxxC domain-containing protein
MRDFKKRNSFGADRREGGGGGFRKPGGFQRTDGRSFERSQMYPAVCGKCNKACEVPFKPNGQRPVYCSDCFGSMKEGGASTGGFAPKRDFSAPRRDYDAPAIATPVMKVEDSRINDLRRQMDGINSKLDRLIESVAILSRVRLASGVKEAVEEAVKPTSKEQVKPVVVKFAGKPMKGAIKLPPKKAAKKEIVKKKKK